MTDTPPVKTATGLLGIVVLAAGLVVYGLGIFGVRVPEAMRFHPAVAASLMVFVGTLLVQLVVPDQSLRFKFTSWAVLLLSLVCGFVAITILE